MVANAVILDVQKTEAKGDLVASLSNLAARFLTQNKVKGAEELKC